MDWPMTQSHCFIWPCSSNTPIWVVHFSGRALGGDKCVRQSGPDESVRERLVRTREHHDWLFWECSVWMFTRKAYIFYHSFRTFIHTSSFRLCVRSIHLKSVRLSPCTHRPKLIIWIEMQINYVRIRLYFVIIHYKHIFFTAWYEA